MPRMLILISLLAALLAPAAGAQEPEKIRDAARRYTFQPPPGWRAFEPEELATINGNLRQRDEKAIPFERGFRPEGSAPNSYPYVLVQVQPTNLAGASYEQLESQFAIDPQTDPAKVEELTGEMVQNLKVGQQVLDRARNRLVMRTQMDIDGIGRVQGLTVGHLGERTIVYLHAFALEGDLPNRMADFNAFNDSFRYDTGAEFRPGPGTWALIRNGSIFGALAGGAIGGLVAFWSWYTRRKAKAR